MEQKTTVVLGASQKPARYSNKALKLLRDYGHPVIPVHPIYDQIEGIPVAHKLDEITQPVDTVTVYLSPETTRKQVDALVDLSPKRVIFNPGAECPEAKDILTRNGVRCEDACTLVLLRTGQF